MRWHVGILVVAGILVGCNRQDLGIAESQRVLLQQERPHVVQMLIEAERAFERGVYEVALGLTDSVEAHAPGLADLHRLRGRIYTQLNRLDVAQAAYETVLDIDPEYAGARFEMGLNGFRRGRLRDAVDLYLAELEIAGPTKEVYHELGRAYAKLGVPDSARMAYEQAIAIDSTFTTSYMWLGQLLEETGDLEGALGASLAGLRYRPDDLDYQYLVGTQYLRLDDVDSALPYLEPVATDRPWHHGAQYSLGQVYMRLGREAEASEYFARADSAQQLQQQINEAQDAINHDPNSPDNFLHLAELLRQSKQYDRAIEAYKVALTTLPPSLELQVNLAVLLIDNGDTDEAAQRLEAIVRADPTMEVAWLNLGVAYGNSGRFGEARLAWESLLEQAPGHAAAQAMLAQLAQMEADSGT